MRELLHGQRRILYEDIGEIRPWPTRNAYLDIVLRVEILDECDEVCTAARELVLTVNENGQSEILTALSGHAGKVVGQRLPGSCRWSKIRVAKDVV